MSTTHNTLPTRFLEEYNKVDTDTKIRFEDEGHHYWLWSPYLSEWVSTKDGCGSANVISTTKVLGDYFPGADFTSMAARIWVNPKNRIAMETDITYKYYGCKSMEDIMNKWSEGATLGTKMHNLFEDLANLVEYDRVHPVNGPSQFKQLFESAEHEDYNEKHYFLEFCEKFGIVEGKRRFWRTEFLMANPVLHISGMIDGLLYDVEDDSYIIIDYKRCKKGLERDPKNPRKQVHELKGNAVGQHLPSFKQLRNHNGNKYGCQLTLYKNLFEYMFPDKRVSGMYLIVVDSLKIGKPGCLDIVEVPLTKYQSCIDEAFAARADHILCAHEDGLPTELIRDLVGYLPKMDEGNPDAMSM